MPKLKAETVQARRQHILDAAKRCIARRGLHGTSMQDICRQAGVSPGALYVYFASKEALIAALCDGERQEFAERLEALASAADFMRGLRALGQEYVRTDRAKDHRLAIDIGLESTRNQRVGASFRRFDRRIVDSLEALFRNMQAEGRIAPALDIPSTVQAFIVLADGMFWRRAVDPVFAAERVLPAVLKLLETLLKPQSTKPRSGAHPARRRPLARPLRQLGLSRHRHHRAIPASGHGSRRSFSAGASGPFWSMRPSSASRSSFHGRFTRLSHFLVAIGQPVGPAGRVPASNVVTTIARIRGSCHGRRWRSLWPGGILISTPLCAGGVDSAMDG